MESSDEQLTLASARGRWVLAATVLGSGLAVLDSTVVNVALPTIGKELHGSVAALQWIVTAYLLTLAALLFIGGYLVQAWSWRLVFFINVPIAIAVVVIARYVPETRAAGVARRLDLAGAALAAVGLGGITYALIELPEHGARAVDVAAGGAI